MLCFPLALIDCLQQEKHRLSPLAVALLSNAIITPNACQSQPPTTTTPHPPPDPTPPSRALVKRAFILITQGLLNKIKIRWLFLEGGEVKRAVISKRSCVRPIQCVQRRLGRCGRHGGGKKNPLLLLLLLLIPEYGQQMTGGKSAAFTVSPRPRR